LLGQTVFVSYACANSYAFNRRSGTPLWTFTTGCEGGGGRTPVAYQGIVYVRDFVTSPYYMLDAATGAQVGSFLAGPPPAFARNTGVYLYNGQLRAVDVGTGTELWQFTGDGALSSAPIIVNGTVYIGSSTGRLFGLDLGTGGLLWQGNAGASILPPDEQNVAAPLTGFGAAEDLLVVPAGNLLVAFEGRTHP
jgi:outer membrane protein assembly factor BamB